MNDDTVDMMCCKSECCGDYYKKKRVGENRSWDFCLPTQLEEGAGCVALVK